MGGERGYHGSEEELQVYSDRVSFKSQRLLTLLAFLTQTNELC